MPVGRVSWFSTLFLSDGIKESMFLPKVTGVIPAIIPAHYLVTAFNCTSQGLWIFPSPMGLTSCSGPPESLVFSFQAVDVHHVWPAAGRRLGFQSAVRKKMRSEWWVWRFSAICTTKSRYYLYEITYRSLWQLNSGIWFFTILTLNTSSRVGIVFLKNSENS